MITALLVAAIAGQVWTVDDDGPADFATIAAAVAAVNGGDTLLVMPGEYGPFTLTKHLAILGPATGPLPRITGDSKVTNVAWVTLAGLDFSHPNVINGRLTLSGIPGRAQIDACTFGAGIFVSGCQQLLVSRTRVQWGGIDVGAGAFPPQSARVALVDSRTKGVSGAGPDVISGIGAPGGPGLRVVTGSQVFTAGSDMVGGDPGDGGCPCGDTAPGSGVHSINSSVFLRGSSWNKVQPGPDPGCYCGAIYGLVLQSSIAIQSGFVPGALSITSSGLYQPSTPEPYLVIRGGDAPGAARQLQLYGPSGAPAVVGVSSGVDLLTLSGVEGDLWLDLNSLVQVFGLVTLGQDVPVTHSWTLPSLVGHEGRSFTVQAAFPTLPGTLDPATFLLTNPASVILRF